MHTNQILSLGAAAITTVPLAANPVASIGGWFRNMADQIVESDRNAYQKDIGVITGEQDRDIRSTLPRLTREQVYARYGAPYRVLPPTESAGGRSAEIWEYRLPQNALTDTTRPVVGFDSTGRTTGHGYRYGYSDRSDRSLPDQTPYRQTARIEPVEPANSTYTAAPQPAPTAQIPQQNSDRFSGRQTMPANTGNGDVCPQSWSYWPDNGGICVEPTRGDRYL